VAIAPIFKKVPFGTVMLLAIEELTPKKQSFFILTCPHTTTCEVKKL